MDDSAPFTPGRVADHFPPSRNNLSAHLNYTIHLRVSKPHPEKAAQSVSTWKFISKSKNRSQALQLHGHIADRQ